MPIELHWNVEERLEGLEAFLSQVADACFARENIAPCWFSVDIVDGETIREINRDTRNVDAETDVLSFPTVNYPVGTTARDNPKRLKREYDPSVGYVNLGDCILNLARAKEQAKEFGHSFMRELGYLTAHSAFHLMGYDHMTEADKQRMRSMEKSVMRDLALYREETVTDAKLYSLACEAVRLSYAPYSQYAVGACILCRDGRTFQGGNIENASYGATLCAERSAIAHALAHGARDFAAIAIVGATSVAYPCGICRQVLREFAPNIRILVGQVGHDFIETDLETLLPHSFGAESLSNP